MNASSDRTPLLAELLERQLDELQFGPCDRLLVFRPMPCGLGGQLSGRVLTLVMALALGRKAVFTSLSDAPYGQTFEALHAPVGDLAGLDDAPAVVIEQDQSERIVIHDPLRMPPINDAFKRTLASRMSQRLGVDASNGALVDGVVFNWLKVLPRVAEWCEGQRARLGVDSDTLGVHFRRGDKAVETAFVPAAVINAKIAEIHAAWPFSKLFLASDSPAAPQEIVCPPGVRLIFDTEEQRFNNANHKMLMNQPELVEQETLVAFKNIHLLSVCGGMVGQNNAHFATIAGAAILARGTPGERVHLISGRIAEEGSATLALLFRLKKALRAVARRLLPHMTATARLQRAMARQNRG